MGRFRKGVSGNPGGRREGSRNRASVLCDRIADEQAADLVKALLRRARGGDLKAISLVLSRVWPPRKGRPVRFLMPPLNSATDLPRALGAVTTAISEGTLSPDEAASIALVLNAQMRAVEIMELETRVKELERKATINETP